VQKLTGRVFPFDQQAYFEIHELRAWFLLDLAPVLIQRIYLGRYPR
jgi:hypothetical protein